MNAAPKALSILLDLAKNSLSDSVKFQASKDLLDRAGFRPIDRREEIRPQRTPAELEAEIKRLVGNEKAELLLGKKSIDDLVQEKVSQQGLFFCARCIPSLCEYDQWIHYSFSSYFARLIPMKIRNKLSLADSGQPLCSVVRALKLPQFEVSTLSGG